LVRFEEIENWMIDWFSKNTISSQEEVTMNVDKNFFEQSWIDSLKFIEFITDIEEKFGIIFNNNEFQDRSFSTIIGLSKIIERKSE